MIKISILWSTYAVAASMKVEIRSIKKKSPKWNSDAFWQLVDYDKPLEAPFCALVQHNCGMRLVNVDIWCVFANLT